MLVTGYSTATTRLKATLIWPNFVCPRAETPTGFLAAALDDQLFPEADQLALHLVDLFFDLSRMVLGRAVELFGDLPASFSDRIL